MKRPNALTILLTTLALALTACSAGSSGIEILGRSAPSDPAACLFSSSGTVFILGNGLYDTTLGGQFSLVLDFKNNLADPKTSNPNAVTQMKSWTPFAARVRLNPKDYAGTYKPSPALAAVTSDTVLPVSGAQTADPAGGLGLVELGLLSNGTLTALQSLTGGGQVVFGITLQGQTGDGARLDANEWFLPIDVCVGCLAAAPTCPTGKTARANTCAGMGQLGEMICQ